MEERELRMLTPENTGANELACRIVRRLLAHDGFARLRAEERDTNTGFFAHLCHVADREVRS